MSVAEIADNRWEVEAAKAPVKGPVALAQMGFILAFSILILGIMAMAVMGTLRGPQQTELERSLSAPAQR